MTHAADPPAPAHAVLDHVVDQARAALRRLCTPRGWILSHLCGCGQPECANDREDTASLAILLRAASTAVTRAEAEPDDTEELRESLLALARAFRLDECPDGNPDCRCAALEAGDTYTVLRTVADAWHGRSGNLVSPTREQLRRMAHAHATNVAALDLLARRLDPDRAAAFRPALPSAGIAEGAWKKEARAMAAEAIATWVPEPAAIPEVSRVLDGALAIAFHGGWTSEDAVAFERVVADACSGLLTRGFAHESVAAALLAGIATVVSPQDLDAEADAELIVDTLA
jgi:hypothetical protein